MVLIFSYFCTFNPGREFVLPVILIYSQMKKKVLVTYNMFREGFAELENKYEVTFPGGDADFTYDEVSEMIPAYDALCPMFNFPVDGRLIDKGSKLRIIANYAAGYNNIDVAFALSKGLAVANTPGPTTEPTANIALALILDTARRVTECDRKLRLLGASMKVGVLENQGLRVTGATLGIIGMGRIGKALCKRARACGMDVIYYTRRRLDAGEETRLEARYAGMDDLLAMSDFVSLNAPYTPDTHHIIGAEELGKMKSTSILINTSRGALVDEKALAEALKAGVIYGAGLDMFEFGDHPLPELLAMDNVVLTPHIGTQTAYSRIEMAKAVSNNVIGFFENDRPISLVV
jgi:lactate dehydrogenase-like 2-hydroxyacid dehydrogenase